jgi:hypothetical protein
VNDRIDLRVLLEDFQRSLVGHIDIVEGRAFSADELDAAQGFLGRVVEVVYYDDIVVCVEELEGCEGSDVSCSSVSLISFVFNCEVNSAQTRGMAYPVTSTALDIVCGAQRLR